MRKLDKSTKARVAQRIEHLTTDQKVGGSNPFARTVFHTIIIEDNRS